MNHLANKQKGAVEAMTIFMWAVGILVSASLGLNTMNANVNGKQEDTLRSHEGDIARSLERTGRIPIIEAKLDRLLEAGNINPRSIERAVIAATSTSSTVISE